MDAFSHETFERLVQACARFYHDTLKNVANISNVHQRREQLTSWIQKFHQDCGTLNSQVEESIGNLRMNPCVLLMTAHQPNLFAYGGVLRKATLIQVLAERLSKELKMPVVSFFGLADQDFTDDRWVKSALLPDVERRDGVLEIRVNLPEKMILNRVAKPTRKTLDSWRDSIKDWIERNLRLASRYTNPLGSKSEDEKNTLINNFDELWSIVEEAASRAEVYSDFNAFIMSRIVNNVWRYNTLFARFSECQQIFGPEFCTILSRFEEYSRYLKEATLPDEDSIGGVYEQEHDTIPFWIHCDCGGKTRLKALQQRENLTGLGNCVRCGKEYQLDFSSKDKPDISDIQTKISARSLSMPLVFFEGLQVACYIGGAGGKRYLQQAKHVAERMRRAFPPVAIWRPRDIYAGIGQLAALSTFEDLSGGLDFSEYHTVKVQLERKIANVNSEIQALELEKKQLAKEVSTNREKRIEQIKNLTSKQDEIRRETGFSLMSRNVKLLENIKSVMSLQPCIIDYAVNIGLEKTSEQWVSYLKDRGNLLSDVNLKTSFDGAVPSDTANNNIR
jgi:hypothetical protein